MAHYLIYAQKDATLYEKRDSKDQNTGRDEILQLAKTVDTDSRYYNSRIVISFNSNDITTAINKIPTNNFTASLKLYSTENFYLGATQSLECIPLAESWQNGTGKSVDLPKTKVGVSWLYKSQPPTSSWDTGFTISGATGSFTGSIAGGGIWYTQSAWVATASFDLADDLDLVFDVTTPVLQFFSGSITNNGFVIKRIKAQEDSLEELGILNYFSTETGTIYPPVLEFKWDDSAYSTGSLLLATGSGDFEVLLKNNKEIYKRNSKHKFNLFVRERFPERTFTTTSNFLTKRAIPENSYYSIIDAYTEDIVIPFGNHSKISHNNEGPYFTLDFQGLQPERYYRILFKLEYTDDIVILDDDYIFKVVR